MVGEANSVVALMSINPQYANLILEGRKKVEFRKTRFAQDVSYVIIYATSPVQRVVGFFEVNGVMEATPDELWQRYHSVGGVDRAFYDAYYQFKQHGIAIEVGNVEILEFPIPLDCLDISSPPQSYRYVNWEVLNWLSQSTGLA
jgi:predicted transcriptional regulator